MITQLGFKFRPTFDSNIDHFEVRGYDEVKNHILTTVYPKNGKPFPSSIELDSLKDLPIERCVFAIPQHHVTEECVRIFGCSYEMNYELKPTSLSMTFLVPFSHCYIFNSLSVFEDFCIKNSDSKTMFPSSDFVRCVVTKDGIFFKNEAIFDFYNKKKNYVPENYEDAIRKETILSLCQDVLCHISLVKNKSK